MPGARETWSRLAAATLVVSAADTRRPIRGIVEIFARHWPTWRFERLATGGHMAPLTHPELVNPIVTRFLEEPACRPR